MALSFDPSRPGIPVAPCHHGHPLDRWPLRDAISLGALPGAVPSARAHVRELLWEWHFPGLRDDVGAVVSELVTNSVAATAGLGPAVQPILVWLGSDTRHVLAAVGDASPCPPVRLNLGPDAEGGRGLALVEAFSTRWGWHPVPRSKSILAKVLWAEWQPAVPPTK